MPAKKHYLTKDGVEKIKRELDDLQKRKRALLDGSGPQAFRFGEVEAEYITFKEDLGRLKERVEELESALENYELIKVPSSKDQSRVHLGANVLIEMNGSVEEFRIVGTIESDPANKKISDQSPIGYALLGKRVGEEIVVKTPMVNHSCRILSIKYENN